MHLHIIDAVLKGLLMGLFMAISVGPTLFAVLKYSLTLSYKAGIAFVLGVSLSDIAYVTIANLAASWLEYLEAYKRPIAFGGAAVLMVIGLIGLIRKHTPERPSDTPIEITGAHYFKIFSSGFLINTLNPGVFITWLGAVTAIANTTLLYRFILFGTCLGLILSFDFLKVFLADNIKRKLTIKRIGFLHKFSAVCILLIGVALFVSTAFNIQFKKHEHKPSAYNHFRLPDKMKGQLTSVSLPPHV